MLLLLRIFFFNDTATTEIYTLSLHDALPIYRQSGISSLPVESHLAQGHSGKGMCEVFHEGARDRKSTRLNSSHGYISYAVFCLKKKIKHYHKSNTRGILLTHRPYSFSHLLAH